MSPSFQKIKENELVKSSQYGVKLSRSNEKNQLIQKEIVRLHQLSINNGKRLENESNILVNSLDGS